MPQIQEKEIADLLLRMGISPGLKGYKYILSAVQLVINEPIAPLHKEIYPPIAQEFDTTPSRVERAIRHAIELAHMFNSPSYQRIVVKYHHNDKKPTNGWFLATVAELLRLELAS